jgi:hypothetical protein
MNQTQRIADAYRAVTLKDAWYGPPLAGLLRQVSPELATTPPIPGTHSISALLQHLLERLCNFSAEDLAKQVPGRDYPYEVLFEGMVQHTVWHAGQIAMISSMLRSRST